MRRNSVLLLMVLLFCISCESTDNKKSESTETAISEEANPKQLPYIGHHEIEDGDTIYHQIPPFGFVNQNGDTITHLSVEGKVYIADFFFTSCGGQCPKMTAAMKRVQQKSKDLDFLLLSYTIDPRRDSSETFQRYIEDAGIDDTNWHFLTGAKADLKRLGERGYLSVSGYTSDDMPNEDNHSDYIYLIDKKRHIRGFYSGTDPDQVNQLIEDLRYLIEHEN